LNTQALTDLVNYVIEKDYADSLIVAGSTGEFYALTYEERIQVFETVKEANAGRLPLIAGTGAATTREAIAYTRKAEELGYDCVMVVSPYYQKATQEGLYLHFKAVAEATNLPMMLYNIPLFTGVNIEAKTLERLVDDVPNILGIKEEAGINPTQTTLFKMVVPEEFTIYCGDDTMVLQTLPQGAVGVVSGGSHVVGDLMKRMIQRYTEGDVAGASDIYLKMFPFFHSLTPGDRVNPIPVLKTVVSQTSGIDLGKPRLPSLGATEEELAKIKEVLRALGKWPAE
ncbi:MAG: 4-hydroxy-tetrahydrodipicolinate synthase, partial [Anaerolineae bacterium]|nr:4-hydroxy-tetrahydrodipicolinate synthase [Anaerolineae bacterium]